MNHRWIKSHKAVQFPHSNLDLSEFLAAIPSETLVRYRQMISSSTPPNGAVESTGESDISDKAPKHSTHSPVHYVNGHSPIIPEVINGNESTRKRLESTSLMTHPVHDEHLIDFHQHRILPGYNKLDITYSLYAAVVCVLKCSSVRVRKLNCSVILVSFWNNGRRALYIVCQKS